MDLRGEEWIQLAQDGDWWRALVNTVMNVGVFSSLPVVFMIFGAKFSPYFLVSTRCEYFSFVAFFDVFYFIGFHIHTFI
jgi:hypothetical protein